MKLKLNKCAKGLCSFTLSVYAPISPHLDKNIVVFTRYYNSNRKINEY